MLRDDNPNDDRPPLEAESQATTIEPGADAVYGEWSEDQGPPPIVARVDGCEERLRFDTTFTIGRGDICDLRVDSAQVSRVHSEVFWANRRWRIRDLGSTNGTFLEGTRIETAELGPRNALRLGAKGPVVWLDVEGAASDPPSLAHYLRRYVDGDPGEVHDGHTGMIRSAFEVARRRQRLRFLAVLAVVSVVGVAVAITGWRFRAAQLVEARTTAGELFYAMKGLELRLREVERSLGPDTPDQDRARIDEGRAQLGDMADAYDRYLRELDLFSDATPATTRLVLRTVRVFGECELAMPPELVSEVGRYIEDWQGSTRLETAVARAAEGDFISRAAAAFDRVDLPPQYALVALQESDFRLDACGPKTRYGIAKGPWQFIPPTARAYGLRVGPLFLERRPDPEDERHDFDRSSDAAARYIRDIYVREAQGSGLLVLAIYNHGGSNIRRMLRSLPETPAARNFWRVLLDHRDRFPTETYDYILRILSAAVVLEDPARFGFDFPSPIRQATPSTLEPAT